MTLSENDERRDLTQGWCAEGETFEQVAQRITPSIWERIKSDFDSGKPAETSAALYAYAFTGLEPTNEDIQGVRGQGRDGAVDIVLTDATGARQVMEVTTSLDRNYQRSSASLSRFEQTVSGAYSGHGSWGLELERDWEALNLRQLAPIIAAALNAVEDGSDDGPHDLHAHVRGWRTGAEAEPRVTVTSRNAGALNRTAPYLDVLTDYLANDGTIRSKIDKLERERPRFSATRTHLYIGMASTGMQGGLLPSSPSYFTWGEFTAPNGLDELWLEGGTGELYRWSRESGWTFHRL